MAPRDKSTCYVQCNFFLFLSLSRANSSPCNRRCFVNHHSVWMYLPIFALALILVSSSIKYRYIIHQSNYGSFRFNMIDTINSWVKYISFLQKCSLFIIFKLFIYIIFIINFLYFFFISHLFLIQSFIPSTLIFYICTISIYINFVNIYIWFLLNTNECLLFGIQFIRCNLWYL